MNLDVSDVVISKCGRDGGKKFFVMEIDGDYALIADGRMRRLEKPKRKKLRHLGLLEHGTGRTAQKIAAGEHVSNGEIRRALHDIESVEEEKGGMHIG
jgi:ribosomal protein L14E/L6E/L27E